VTSGRRPVSQSYFSNKRGLPVKQTAVHLAIASALALGAAGTAQANFKGIAINQIENFTLTSDGTFNVVNSFLGSTAQATWGANSENNGVVNPPYDPEVADCGPSGCNFGAPENAFVQLAGPEPFVGQNWARGDAVIFEPDILNGGAASNVAEVVAAPGTTTPVPGQPSANGVNTLDAQFDLTLSGDQTLTFNFDSEIFMEVWTADESAKGESIVRSALGFDITFTRNSTGDQFTWSPDGEDLNSPDFIDTSDPFSLNQGLVSFNGVGNDTIDEGPSRFMASIFLPGDDYTLAITMTESATGRQVPVPATIALIGAGLLGLSIVRRRRFQG
jgi:hypothetical protein